MASSGFGSDFKHHEYKFTIDDLRRAAHSAACIPSSGSKLRGDKPRFMLLSSSIPVLERPLCCITSVMKNNCLLADVPLDDKVLST